MQLLLIENEATTRTYIAKGLTENGYQVHAVESGEEGLFILKECHIDCVILDIILPTIDGWSVMKVIRKHYPHVKVLFLTAIDDVESKVKGLEMGADDYLVKPFSFSELLARVRSLLRRTGISTTEVLSIDNLVVDLIKQKVCRDEIDIKLTSKEYRLLIYLLENKGRILSRTMISQYVWDINFDSNTNVVDVTIKRLREKIDAPFSKKLIHNVRGLGYRIDD